MELNEFSIGDRVELIEEEDSLVIPGMTGIVRGIGVGERERIQVEIDEKYYFSQLHNCGGVITNFRGWNILPHKLKLVTPRKVITLSKLKRDTKIKKIIKEINTNKSYKSCFKDINKEINEWTDQQINNW